MSDWVQEILIKIIIVCVVIPLTSGRSHGRYFFSNNKNQNCEGSCVPYNQCGIQEHPSSVGQGLIDVRFGFHDESRECLKEGYICCPSDQINFPPQTQHKCGFRGNDELEMKILGIHNEAHYGEFPWMVAVMTMEEIFDKVIDVYHCGGSLIHPRVVLTAAHSIWKLNPKSMKIRAGEWYSKTDDEILPHQDRYLKDYVIHEHYADTDLANDVALLFLEKPVYLTNSVQTICLPPQGLSFDNYHCLASGWGEDSFADNGKFQAILKKVELPIIPNLKCEVQLRNTQLGDYFELDNSFICAGGEKEKDTCKGDGGSPLVCPIKGTKDQFYQAGIVSWGIGCGRNNVPGVYTNVAAFIDWIDNLLIKRGLDTDYYKKDGNNNSHL